MANRRILSLRLDNRLRAKLDALATATRRSRSYLAAEGIRDYGALQAGRPKKFLRGQRRRIAETLRARAK